MKTYYDIMNDITKYDLFAGLLGNGTFSDYVRYENMRKVNVPCQHGIPCPVQYMKLCKCIVDLWDEIREHFKKYTQGQEHKISLLHIRKIKNTQSLFKMSYENWHEDEDLDTFLRIGKRVIVKADISNCFPSIYTHAIPWAFVGKCEARRNKKVGSWYNEIDKYLRYCKNNETHKGVGWTSCAITGVTRKPPTRSVRKKRKFTSPTTMLWKQLAQWSI